MLDLAVSKTVCGRTFTHLFDAVSRTVQLPKDGGDGTVDWEFADPSLLIPLTLSKSSQLQDRYDRALRDHKIHGT